jgi:hypothetical protein
LPTKESTGKKRIGLPKSATITISQGKPVPSDEVDVTPDAGRIHFKNKDKADHRLRLWRKGTDPNKGIDILLPAGGRTTVVIRSNDEFNYDVLSIKNLIINATYGPIKN